MFILCSIDNLSLSFWVHGLCCKLLYFMIFVIVIKQHSLTYHFSFIQAIGSKPVVRDLDFSGCGSTKGCFLYPRHCSNSNCLAAVSFQHRPHTDDYLFEMYTTAENYISLGFSEDIMMVCVRMFTLCLLLYCVQCSCLTTVFF